MKFKFINCGLVLFLCLLVAFSQGQINSNFLFVDHLTHTNKNREALFLLDKANEITNTDTSNYLRGMNYYFLKKTDSAALYFNSVAIQSNFYTKSKFFESVNLSYSKKYTEALTAFSNFSVDTTQKYEQLIGLMRAGNYLLLRDHKKFDSIGVGFLFNDFRYSNEQTHLIELKKDVLKLKKKSPAVAGLLSAVVPGLGKFYAGKKGAGLAAFAANGALAAMAFESYYRTKSFKSPQFITFGTLFTFFYVGNIFGSVFSVKQQIRSVNGKINNEILASIHVPVVRFFK